MFDKWYFRALDCIMKLIISLPAVYQYVQKYPYWTPVSIDRPFFFFKTVVNCVMMGYRSILFSLFWLSVRVQYSYIWLLSPVLFFLSVVRSCSLLPFLLWHYSVLINLQKLFSALRILTVHIFVYCLIVHSFSCALYFGLMVFLTSRSCNFT